MHYVLAKNINKKEAIANLQQPHYFL